MRGRLVSINQLTIVIGILLAQMVNWLIAEPVPPGATAEADPPSWNGQMGWRWMFGVTAIPSLLFFLGMFFVPESPRWLAKGRPRTAVPADPGQGRRRGLCRRPWPRSGRPWATTRTPAGSIPANCSIPDPPGPGARRGAGGIPAVVRHQRDLQLCRGDLRGGRLRRLRHPVQHRDHRAVNLVFTFVAIGTVDRVGRRTLMLAGSAGLAVIYCLIGLATAATSRARTCSAGAGGHRLLRLTLAPVTWVVISEIFPNRIRGAAMAVAVFALWVGCFILTYTFPLLKARSGGHLLAVRGGLRAWASSLSCCGFPRPRGRRSKRSKFCSRDFPRDENDGEHE